MDDLQEPIYLYEDENSNREQTENEGLKINSTFPLYYYFIGGGLFGYLASKI